MKVTKLTREQLLKSNYDAKIGEVIEIDGNKYTPIEVCTACPFRNDEIPCNYLECSSAYRIDGKSVLFLKINI